MKFTSIDRIFNKLDRDLPIEVDEVDIIEWTGEALSAIKSKRYVEEAVRFLQVNDWQTLLPNNFHYVVQIAKNQQAITITETEISDTDEVIGEPETDYPVCLDCNGVPYEGYDVAYYRPYYDLKYEYKFFYGNKTFQRCYVPVRLATSSFFNSVVCSDDNSDCNILLNGDLKNTGLYKSSSYEYTVVKDEVLRFNFQEGIIALAYTRNITDKDGLPMIPDDYSVTTAIVSYITMKIMKRLFYLGKEGSVSKLQKAEEDWNWYVSQAKSNAKMPQTIDEYENLMNQRSYLIPRRRQYNNFFGNLNKPEIQNILNSKR